VLLAEVAMVHEAAAAAEATCATTMITVETSTREAVVARDSAALQFRDGEDRTTLVDREALERVWRVEVENITVLACAHDNVEGFVWKITLLEDELAAVHQAWEVSESEHRAQFEELTLL
jgi:hypothetical protein